jgi:uncharacterized protein with GYD domain
MATFIATLKFTQQGIENIRDSPKRLAAFKSTAKTMGIKLKDAYWTLGSVDGVLIFDAPDDETATAAMLHSGSIGYVQTSTMRAFDAGEMEKILGKLPAT